MHLRHQVRLLLVRHPSLWWAAVGLTSPSSSASPSPARSAAGRARAAIVGRAPPVWVASAAVAPGEPLHRRGAATTRWRSSHPMRVTDCRPAPWPADARRARGGGGRRRREPAGRRARAGRLGRGADRPACLGGPRRRRRCCVRQRRPPGRRRRGVARDEEQVVVAVPAEAAAAVAQAVPGGGGSSVWRCSAGAPRPRVYPNGRGAGQSVVVPGRIRDDHGRGSSQ